MIGIIVFLLVAAGSVALNGQDVKVFTHQTTSAVHLRWIGNSDVAVNGWHIDRSIDGAPAVRLTSAPLRRILDVAEMDAAVGRYATSYFLTLHGVQERRTLTVEDLRRVFANKNELGLFFAFLAAQPQLSTLTGERYVDSTAPSTGTAVYRIVAVVASDEKVLATTKPIRLGELVDIDSPRALDALGGDNLVTLSWQNTISDNTEIVGFRVYRSSAINGPYSQRTLLTTIATRPPGGEDKSTYEDAFADNGTTMFYYVTNVHATGNESVRSNIAEVRVGRDVLPLPVSGLRAMAYGNAVQLRWDVATSASSYRLAVLRTDAKGVRREVHGTSMTSDVDTSALDALVNVGEPYTYVVASFNDGDTVYSQSVSFIIPDDVPPMPPTNLRATSDTGMITLTWHPPADNDVAGYHVQRSSHTARVNFMQLTSNLLTDSTYVDVLAANQTTHAYTVVSVDAVGNRSAPSAIIVARTIDVTPPAQPEITRVSRQGTTVTLSWSEPTDEDVQHSDVERSFNGAPWQRRARVTATTYTDTLGDAGSYQFRVVVVDSAGNRSTPSSPRDVDRELTLAAPANLSIVKESFALRITWTPVAGAAGYRVQRQHASNNEIIDCAQLEGSTAQWIDRISDRSLSWTYIVTARTQDWVYGTPTQKTYRPNE